MSPIYGEFTINDFAGLETLDDSSSKEFQEFQDFWLACAKRQMSLRPASPSHEELMKRKQERNRKSLVIALNTYAKRNNMQITDFEFVEEKERNLVSGMLGGYVHSNFVVKGVDGRPTLFFAEMEHDCFQEEHSVLCYLMSSDDSGCCFGCNKRARKLMHPTCGGYLGGLEDVPFPYVEEDSDDECFLE
ncbi:uncharacterized protein [Triticum aestivum]|uniref:uncharacterized protein n=2 Tax=Triticinae TaxID=1648030 RepID=UPI001D030D12|nr:uncharacterized protein LOC123100689 [Triticum aestivum]